MSMLFMLDSVRGDLQAHSSGHPEVFARAFLLSVDHVLGFIITGFGESE